jgi:hypothetical protein
MRILQKTNEPTLLQNASSFSKRDFFFFWW